MPRDGWVSNSPLSSARAPTDIGVRSTSRRIRVASGPQRVDAVLGQPTARGTTGRVVAAGAGDAAGRAGGDERGAGRGGRVSLAELGVRRCSVTTDSIDVVDKMRSFPPGLPFGYVGYWVRPEHSLHRAYLLWRPRLPVSSLHRRKRSRLALLGDMSRRIQISTLQSGSSPVRAPFFFPRLFWLVCAFGRISAGDRDDIGIH